VLDAERLNDAGLARFEHQAIGEHPVLHAPGQQVSFECDERMPRSVRYDELANDRRAFAFSNLHICGLPLKSTQCGRVHPDREQAEGAEVGAVSDMEGRELHGHGDSLH
jgi:hypothetical protein